MTDELNRSSADQEKTELLSEMLPIETNAVTVAVEPTLDDNLSGKGTVEPVPDWLKPMEEDDDIVEHDKTIEQSTNKTNPGGVKVKRGRGRPPRPKTVRARLNMMKALRGGANAQNASAGTPDKSTRSSLSSRTAASETGCGRTPEVLPRTPQSVPHSLIPTPQKPQLTPTSPVGSISIFSATEFCSPPRLTRVSPLIIDTAVRQIPSHPPSSQLIHASHQITSATTPGQNSSELPLHLWQCPSMEPISPPKTQDTLLDQTESIGSPDFPNAALNGRRPEEEEILSLLSDCVSCGCPFPVRNARDTLCHKCKPSNFIFAAEKKHSPPNIVFRKVGQDQWEVGKTNHQKKLKSRPKYKKMFKKDFVPDGDDDEDDEDEQGGGSKKRNRRMCQRCVACLRDSDCGVCDFCMDKPKFGGSNKKRQKCRLRQCKFQSKLHVQANGMPRKKKNLKQKFKKRGRPAKKARIRRDPWDEDDDDYVTEKEDETTEMRRYMNKGARRRERRKWNYSFKGEEDEMFVETVIDEADVLGESDALSLVQNEPVKIVVANSSEHQSQEIYYTMTGLPDASRMLRPVTLCNNNLEPVNEAGSAGVTQNDILQIEMVRVGSPLSQFIEPQNTAQPASEPAEPADHTPVITQIFSLAVGTETDFERDPGLMELFTTLRQTVLPAHWVGVMAKGPILQLLQCSKLSTMADTVVQIEKGFFYQISVQNQPLLLMHSIYMRHPTCLTSVSEVVSLLLDLEGLSVCQGHQSFNLGSPWEPKMCVRAALCDLLVPKDEEQCEKCAQPTEA